MPIHNKQVAEQFSRLADLLEIQGANTFRVRAYRNAAQTVESLPRDAQEMLDDGEDLSELPGIGADLAGKIEEIIKNGELALLQETEEQTTAELGEMMKLPGVGPKRVKAIHDALGVESLGQLKEAAEKRQVRQLEGFGRKTEAMILREIERRKDHEQRTKLSSVDPIARSLEQYLSGIDGVKKVVVAGSYRRRKETVGDLDILITCKDDSPVMDRFVEYDEIEEVVEHGRTRSMVILQSGLQVDLRVMPEVCYGAALYYFTGSKAHNIAVRRIAQEEGLKINEYGVFRGEDRIAGATEEEVFQQVGLPFIPPELRENRGEVEAAKAGALPQLIALGDVRGNLHAHTKDSDGKYTLQQMAQAARQAGLEYLAITDHSRAVAAVKGLDAKGLRKQIERIDALNDELSGIRILKGIEVDILEDGSLDLDDHVLGELDLVVGSIHSKFNLPKKKQTERVIRAMDHVCFHILGHPTGRLINEREPYEIDIERIMDAALDRGCYMELNAQPDRLDLNDAHCKLAREKGLKVAISVDAHSTTDLEFMRFGIDQARRGWLEADDVLNTRTWGELKGLLKRD
ncbi:DNA polymerase/3'-5' exonuclease PolX [Thioalkalivibrio sp.]|uniref:DNA polymerase/3'-5' exonuclease PolX n=1 Tax=Thioalkalivibrio sp. TaxID=2093813 RepID=UPI00356994CA